MTRSITAIASTLFVLAAASAHAGDPVAGQEKAQACIACHGETGVGQATEFPILAGQHQSYLYHVMREYRDGERVDPVMNAQMGGYSDQDLRDLAAFYARQDGGVYDTPVRRGAQIVD